MINLNRILLIVILVVAISSSGLYSQCPMCRMAAETNLGSGGTAGKGLNAGILYLLAIPYLMVFVLGLIWRKHRSKLANSDR
ncbi:MAG: hypothetical protein IPM34_08260 [Saprospiraceae bacterium]|nr:hypothetical protein [Saprospiraceae bacterium]